MSTTDPSAEYPRLGLRTWPFHVVASEATAEVWVGRPDLQRKVDRLQRSAARVPNSQIVLLWASFGAGKTHALMHLRRLAQAQPTLTPLYVVTPRGVRSFVDLYRAVADAAVQAGLAQAAGRQILLRDEEPRNDTERALRQLASGDNEQAQLATAWLLGDKISARNRSALGLTTGLDTAAAAIDGLQRLVHALQAGGQRLLLLLDEVQELAELGHRLDECTGGLHKLFDSTPRGLTLVLSFTTGSQATLRTVLGDTLWDRVSQVIAVPALNEVEAEEFVYGLLRASASEPDRAPHPFTPEAVRALVKTVVASHPVLTPRAVIRAADQALREALPDLEDGVVTEIGPELIAELADLD